MRNFLQKMDDAYDLGYENARDGVVNCPFDKVTEEAETHQWNCGFQDYKKGIQITIKSKTKTESI